MTRSQLLRGIHIVSKTIKELKLDLTGKTVLTELGSNDFSFTPIIPVLANSKKIYAVARDSRFGTAEKLKEDFIKNFGHIPEFGRIEIFCNEIPSHCIAEADIITNSYPLRPLDTLKLSLAKKGVVIPVMYESWELRNSEIDIAYCRQQKIKVGGTWESYPVINVFEYVRILGLKLALNAGYEVAGNKIFVWSDDSFGNEITASFKNNGAEVTLGIDTDLFYQLLPTLDFIFITDYNEHRPFFAHPDAIFSIDRIKEINLRLGIVHLYGLIDADALSAAGFNVYPARNGCAESMTETLAYSGQVPVLNLLTAGFKVGQEMIEEKYSELTQLLS